MAQKILIVDDDRATREGLALLLAEDGYETLMASDVAAAMHVLTQTPPDLLITEVRLETYNGLHIVAMAPRPLRAIVVTGYADAAIEADARRLGAEYLLKPVAPTVLRGVIARLLTNPDAGMFYQARACPRIALMPPIPASVGDRAGVILDVSETGARVRVEGASGEELPESFALVCPGNTAFLVWVAWKRRVAESGWTCGVTVDEGAHAQWRAFVPSLTAMRAATG